MLHRVKFRDPDAVPCDSSLASLFSVFNSDPFHTSILFQGKNDEALSLLERSLAMREKALGFAHPDIAESLINKAGLFGVQVRAFKANENLWYGDRLGCRREVAFIIDSPLAYAGISLALHFRASSWKLNRCTNGHWTLLCGRITPTLQRYSTIWRWCWRRRWGTASTFREEMVQARVFRFACVDLWECF